MPSPHRVFVLPATALATDSHGSAWPSSTLTPRSTWSRWSSSATPARPIEIAGGLAGSDQVVKLASADLIEGKLVDVGR